MSFNCGNKEYTTALLCLIVVFLFADQNLLAPNLSLIAFEFGFTNSERDNLLGGQIAIGFFIVGGFISLLAGYLADSMNRIILFAVIVFLGELACLSTYWTTTYTELYICRVMTGISIGGATPIVFSLLADLYPGDSRVSVSTFVGISMAGGIGKNYDPFLLNCIHYYMLIRYFINIHILYSNWTSTCRLPRTVLRLAVTLPTSSMPGPVFRRHPVSDWTRTGTTTDIHYY